MAQSKEETVLDEAKDLLAQGKRFMALEDYRSATDCLEMSCQLYDSFYGVAKRECADAYFEYGLALVALANLEAGTGTDKIMKKAGINGDDDDDEAQNDDDEDEEEENDEEEEGEGEDGDDADEADENNEKEAEKQNGKDHTTTEKDEANGTSEKNQDVDMVNDSEPVTAQPSASTSTDNEPKPGTSLGNEAKDDESVENEEATTIEIAWEVLCLAKRLFMTDESLMGRLKLAETLQKLGEISIEWENNDNAVSILQECLEIRQAILPPEDRLIALTYYHLGLAHSFKSEVQEANNNFSKAIEVIEKRIATLEKDLEKGKESQDTVAVSMYIKEINELKELLPDMYMRLDDSKDDGPKGPEVLKRTREEMQQEDEEAKKVCSDKSKPVDDISHLVKRKAT